MQKAFQSALPLATEPYKPESAVPFALSTSAMADTSLVQGLQELRACHFGFRMGLGIDSECLNGACTRFFCRVWMVAKKRKRVSPPTVTLGAGLHRRLRAVLQPSTKKCVSPTLSTPLTAITASTSQHQQD